MTPYACRRESPRHEWSPAAAHAATKRARKLGIPAVPGRVRVQSGRVIMSRAPPGNTAAEALRRRSARRWHMCQQFGGLNWRWCKCGSRTRGHHLLGPSWPDIATHRAVHGSRIPSVWGNPSVPPPAPKSPLRVTLHSRSLLSRCDSPPVFRASRRSPACASCGRHPLAGLHCLDAGLAMAGRGFYEHQTTRTGRAAERLQKRNERTHARSQGASAACGARVQMHAAQVFKRQGFGLRLLGLER